MIYGIGRIHSHEKRCEKWRVRSLSHRSLKSASTECKLSSRQSKRWLDRTGWGERMAKRWDDSRFPWAFRSKGYIRALKRTFQFALKSPGPGLMPLINIRDKPTHPVCLHFRPVILVNRVSTNPSIPEGIADGNSQLGTRFHLERITRRGWEGGEFRGGL